MKQILILVSLIFCFGIVNAEEVVYLNCDKAKNPKDWKRQKDISQEYVRVLISGGLDQGLEIEKGIWRFNHDTGEFDYKGNNAQIYLDENFYLYPSPRTRISRKTLEMMNYQSDKRGQCRLVTEQEFYNEINRIISAATEGNVF